MLGPALHLPQITHRTVTQLPGELARLVSVAAVWLGAHNHLRATQIFSPMRDALKTLSRLSPSKARVSVKPNSYPRHIITSLVMVGLGLGVVEGLGLGNAGVFLMQCCNVEL